MIEVRRAITMTYAVGYFIRFTDLEKEMFEMQQSMLWEALDNLDKFTDDIQNAEVMHNMLIDEVQGGTISIYLLITLNSRKLSCRKI